MELDRTDLRLLNELQQDGRRTVVELAETVGLTHTPCARRVRQLEQTGIIQGYAAIVDPARLGLSVQAFVQVRLERHTDDNVAQFNIPSDTDRFGLNPQTLDLEKGWRAFGGNQNQQVVAKVTFQQSGTVKLSASMAQQARQRQTYDRRYLLAYTGEPWDKVNNLMDSLGVSSSRNLQHIVQGSTRDESYFYAFKAEKRFQRANISASVGRGDRCMVSGSAGSTLRASPGSPSVTRLIHRMWIGRSGIGSPANGARAIAQISPEL